MFRLPSHALKLWPVSLLLTALVGIIAHARQANDAAATAKALDQEIIVRAKNGSELMVNITHLCDVIGPRLTGCAALKKANDWAADKMKAYGLVNVQNEPYLFPEGWERGPISARLVEPDNGVKLSLASWCWVPGTEGKIQADLVLIAAEKEKDLTAYKGKLKGKVVLFGPPAKLRPLTEIDKPFGSFASALEPHKDGTDPVDWGMSFAKEDLLKSEGAAAVLHDCERHFGLLSAASPFFITSERPSALHRIPICNVAHHHYAMLCRLASRPAPARTRIELEVSNKFIAGPLKVFNTVGDIRGTDKPDEFVILGAHLDSWDLGQGALDNGTGTCVILEAARILAQCPRPKRTIRFVLFTGEEQGSRGSMAFVKQHQDEMPKTSAFLNHDRGTGKVIGLAWAGEREAFGSILETEMVSLKELGAKYVDGRTTSNSDQWSFSNVGVPACAVDQEIAGYRLAWHSEADTLALVREPGLIQGAQVMSVTAMRLANLDKLLPRSKK
jgi:hypothetical protein